jgi:hypothetical protein
MPHLRYDLLKSELSPSGAYFGLIASATKA